VTNGSGMLIIAGENVTLRGKRERKDEKQETLMFYD
jgi:hypothetical protein